MPEPGGFLRFLDSDRTTLAAALRTIQSGNTVGMNILTSIGKFDETTTHFKCVRDTPHLACWLKAATAKSGF